jgi:clan AA aspartic protease (TIGR02281 family)
MDLHTFGLAGISLTLAISVATGKDSENAARLLEDRGLTRQGTVWILPGESNLNRAMREVRTLDRKVKTARRAATRMARNLEGLDDEMKSLKRRRHEIGRQLSQLDARRHNQAIATLNQITVRLAELHDYKYTSDEPGEVATAMAAATQTYIQHILDTRRATDEVTRAYKEIAEDGAVTAALTELSQEQPNTLGPSRRFLKAVEHLQRLEKTVHSEQISLRRQAGTFMVPVVFNGKVTKELVFDSGASAISLPAAMAAEIGLIPSATDPKTNLWIADGSVVVATIMTIPLARVGTFEAKDVRCIVLPPEMKNAPALLGGTFLNRFGYRIDTGTATLTLHRLDDDSSDR